MQKSVPAIVQPQGDSERRSRNVIRLNNAETDESELPHRSPRADSQFGQDV